MARGAATLVIGAALGIVGVLLYSRLRARLSEDDADELVSRLTRQLLALETETSLAE